MRSCGVSIHSELVECRQTYIITVPNSSSEPGLEHQVWTLHFIMPIYSSNTTWRAVFSLVITVHSNVFIHSFRCVSSFWWTSILLEQGQVALLPWMCLVCCKLDNIDTCLGHDVHYWVHKTEQRPEGSDDIFGYECEHRQGVLPTACVNWSGCLDWWQLWWSCLDLVPLSCFSCASGEDSFKDRCLVAYLL